MYQIMTIGGIPPQLINHGLLIRGWHYSRWSCLRFHINFLDMTIEVYLSNSGHSHLKKSIVKDVKWFQGFFRFHFRPGPVVNHKGVLIESYWFRSAEEIHICHGKFTHHSRLNMEVSMAGYPNAWFLRENPMKMNDDWGYPYDLGNLHIMYIYPSFLFWFFNFCGQSSFTIDMYLPIIIYRSYVCMFMYQSWSTNWWIVTITKHISEYCVVSHSKSHNKIPQQNPTNISHFMPCPVVFHRISIHKTPQITSPSWRQKPGLDCTHLVRPVSGWTCRPWDGGKCWNWLMHGQGFFDQQKTPFPSIFVQKTRVTNAVPGILSILSVVSFFLPSIDVQTCFHADLVAADWGLKWGQVDLTLLDLGDPKSQDLGSPSCQKPSNF